MNLLDEIESRTTDGVLWLAKRYWDAAGTSMVRQIFAQNSIATLLLKIESKAARKRYAGAICNNNDNLKVSDLKEAMADVEYNLAEAKKKQKPLFSHNDGEADTSKVPSVMDKNMVERHGFSEVKVMHKNEIAQPRHYGYFFYTDNSNWQNNQITNFTMETVAKIYDAKDTMYVVALDNGFRNGKTVLMLEQARAMWQKEAMQAEIGVEGNYYVLGSQQAFIKIAMFFSQEFESKKCFPIKKLGWQRKGFWSYMDKIFVPGKGMQDLDEWGMAPVGENKYIVPAFSAAYAKQRESNPERFEDEEMLTYCQSPITLDEYLADMNKVFGDNGLIGAAYGIMTLFRDVIFDVNGCFPHLNGVGPKSTGKSVWGEFISKLFYTNRTFFQLNSGTDAGFYTYLAQFPNSLAVMNEFDRANLKIDEWYYAFKGLYDGEAKVKNSMTHRGRNEIIKVLSGIILLGQYLNTDDDNSVLSRSLVCAFTRDDFSQKEIDALNSFKDKIEGGINSLLGDLMEHRLFFEQQFGDRYRELMKVWRAKFPNDQAYNQRIMQNWCYSATTMHIIAERMNLPTFDAVKYNELCFKRGASSCKQLRDTDALSEFWRMIEVLCNDGTLRYGWDYQIKMETSVKVKVGSKGKVDIPLGEPTAVLYLQMGTAHKKYADQFKGTQNASFKLETITTYMSHRDYTIGLKDNMRRKLGNEKGQTSYHAFRYKDLQINIDRESAAEEEGRLLADDNGESITAQIIDNNKTDEDGLPF